MSKTIKGKRETNKKRRRELPPISDEVWNGINNTRKEFNITWEDLFERCYNYQDWFAHLLRLSKKPSKIDMMNATTVQYYIGMWLENLYKNFLESNIKDIQDIKAIMNIAKDRPAVVIGAGPSLQEYHHLELLAESKLYTNKIGTIITTSHGLKDCLEAGIVPDYMILIDPEPVMIDHFNHSIVEKHMKEVTAIFTISINHEVFEAWKGNKIFFQSIIPESTIPNVHAVLSGLFRNITEMDAGANAGTTSFSVATLMGCNPIALIGMDLSFLPDTPVEETPYYNTFRPAFETKEEMMKECYHFHTHSFFGNKCYTDKIYYNFVRGFISGAKLAKDKKGVRTINCSGRGVIDQQDIIENMHFTDFLKKWE